MPDTEHGGDITTRSSVSGAIEVTLFQRLNVAISVMNQYWSSEGRRIKAVSHLCQLVDRKASNNINPWRT
jgi:hypothetical protein